jgi:two-component system, NtrC family, response regulator GlrR
MFEGDPSIDTTNRLPTTVEVRSAELRVTRGPDTGHVQRIDSPTFTVGKGVDASLRLRDETVSREHLRFELTPAGVLVSDLGSKNGTWVGGIRLDRAMLTTDVSLALGATSLEVRVEARTTPLRVSDTTRFGAAIGHSTAMRHVFGLLQRAAATELTILLEGESGVGKELLARAVHLASPRRAGPFVTVDCGSIPAGVIESELFGHERGAFTGADHGRVGLFREADGGTIFLDELGELPIEHQPKLLRVLEQREVRAVGSNVARPVNVRVVVATNRNLAEQVKNGELREDLFYRLAVARVRIPPLRERSDDIVAIATSVLRDTTGVADAALAPDFASMLQTYSWPGNVRELRNVVGRYALLGARQRQDLFDTTGRLVGGAAVEQDLAALHYYDARKLVIDRFEASYAESIMQRAAGVIARAADLAGMPRSSFYRMLERQGKAPDSER